jgi:hypothetical protein
MRRLIVSLLVLVGILAILDRVSVSFAESAVAKRIQTSQQLSSKPGVSIGGFPFLTQAIGGRYDDVTVTGLVRGQLRIARLVVDLHGVHLPLRVVVGGHLSGIPVDTGAGTLFVTYADLNSSLRSQNLAVTYAGTPGEVRVTSGPLSGTAQLAVSGVTIKADIAGPLGFSRTLTGLPFGITLSGATSDPSGITVTASGTDFTIPA